jgi:hypothetical protein
VLPTIGAVVTETEADTSGSAILIILPTPALPGQVRTVDSPSCPLSALGVRSRVWTVCRLAQASGEWEYELIHDALYS